MVTAKVTRTGLDPVKRSATTRNRRKRRRDRREIPPPLHPKQGLGPHPPPEELLQLLRQRNPRQLDNPAGPGRGRFLPSKLFSRSSRSRLVELLASAREAKYYLGHHKSLIYGDEGTPVNHRGASHTCSERPHTPNQVLPEVWNISRYWYNADNRVNIVDDYVHRWCRVFLRHGTLWTGSSENAAHRSQRLEVRPLKSRHWPSNLEGPSWPSFPSITEWMEMLRKGLDPFTRQELNTPIADSGYTRVSRGELHENHVLATRIVSNVIVGIRSSVEIPRKFLKYFRYSQNFLILTVRHNLPIGLVRFLLGQWCVAPYSLWLRRAVLLKQYLRKVPTLLVRQARSRLAAYKYDLYLAEQGCCTPSADDQPEYYSDGSSELD